MYRLRQGAGWNRMEKSTSDKKAVIQSLEMGIQLVDLIVQNGQPMKFNDIHQSTGITKSNLYKYLNTLTQLGLLYRHPESGQYHLGSRLIEYGMAAADREDMIDRVIPYLQEINAYCKETVLLSIWTDHGPMVVKMYSSYQDINLGARIGTHLPLQSAAGKVFAAFSDEVRIKEWKEKEWSKLTEQEQDDLAAELEKVRQEGIAFAREPLVPYISAIALPVFNYEGQLVLSFIVVGFSENIPSDLDHPLSRYLLDKSKELSVLCGYRSD